MKIYPLPALSIFFLFWGGARAQDLSLKEALSEANQSSPQLDKVRSARDEAYWKKVESYQGFLPSVNASVNYLMGHKYILTDVVLPPAGTLSIPNVIPTTIYTLNAQMPIFDGFANVSRYRATRSFEASAENELSWTQFQVNRQVILQFYRALAAQTLGEVAQQNAKTLEDHLKDVNQFRKSGISTNYDVLRVEVQVSEARSEILNTQDNIEIMKGRLAEILGRNDENRSLHGQLPVLGAELLKNFNAKAADQRKDILALQQKTEALAHQEAAASRFWIPRISLFGQYQYYNNRNNHLMDSDRFRDAYSIGLSLNWNLFDGMGSIAKSRQSIEQRYQAEKSAQMARIRATQDVDMWRRKFIYYSSVYQARLNDVQKSNESVRLARDGRRAGVRTNTDLLDAELELFRAKAGVVNAQMGAVEALVNFELATGQKVYDFN